jgi:hypothetical protein
VTNHDDDVLIMECYENGRGVDSYNSRPDCFTSLGGTRAGPVGGDPAVLARLCGGGDTSAVDAVLRGDYVLEILRHQELVQALDLPAASVGMGYTYVSSGELPPEAGEKFIRFGE